ncbi:MAG: ribose-5-phosphate isomerase RpiA [Treponema sp.]|nr:ribose-5-phosphate isomerase RpiA [Treponema sp.]
MSQTEQKKRVAITAVDMLVERGLFFSGMKVGLGTGSTALPVVERLADYIHDGTLTDVKAVVTSFQTADACDELGIAVYSMNDRTIAGTLDIAIDGADEIDRECNLIKGGGAALLREKIVAYNACQFIIVADESKAVATIGTGFPVPVEIIVEARVPVVRALSSLGALCVLRAGIKKCGPVITDNGNQILDCTWESPIDPEKMERDITAIAGVVEVGLFTRCKPRVFIAHADGSVEERQPRA